METDERLRRLAQAVIEGDAEAAKKAAEDALKSGIDPTMAIQEGIAKAFAIINEKWVKEEIFLPEVMLAADAMKAGFAVLEPAIVGDKKGKKLRGTVVIGTVKGDIHDIGEKIVAAYLSAGGFYVYDLGREIEPMGFVEKAQEVSADIIALSALMTSTMPWQRETIALLESMGIRDRYKVIVGGAPVTPQFAREIGADGYGKHAVEAVDVANKVLGGNYKWE